MCLLNIVDENNAMGAVQITYREIKSVFGVIPTGFKLWSIEPDMLQHHWEDVKQSLSQDAEMQKFNAIMRYLISEIEGCDYCVGFNSGLLINVFGMTQEELFNMAREPQSAPLSDIQKAHLLFALKVVNEPKNINSSDVDKLRALNMSDQEIFQLAHKSAKLAMTDMLLTAFKVQD
ncbi:MAG: hypothetical protein JU82_07595 [Sulfuricurvum sp. MLSB]|uniref:carboxymuconolactone decarboxylase family protein n=1 Tax=unclassified Sulfuricurvum TaxID=2632390 RepID=UPI0005055A37|nr:MULTISPECIES: hypothetical protein [unclassified Sulfuricurvum]KFN39324.1 MAG: hypothetical protein JU82_07595 [Sulfuricurvum sp. MLSB]